MSTTTNLHDLSLAEIEEIAQIEIKRRRKIGEATRRRWARAKADGSVDQWRANMSRAHRRRFAKRSQNTPDNLGEEEA